MGKVEATRSAGQDRLRLNALIATVYGITLTVLGFAGFTIFVLLEKPNTSEDKSGVGWLFALIVLFALMALGSGLKYRKMLLLKPDNTLSGDVPRALQQLIGSFFFVAIICTVALGIPILATIGVVYGVGAIFGEDAGVIKLMAGGFTLLSGIVICFVFAKALENRRCPNCGRLWSSIVEHTEFLGQSVSTVQTSQVANVREGFDRFGSVLANITIPGQKTVVTNRYATHRRCKACDHRWTTR